MGTPTVNLDRALQIAVQLEDDALIARLRAGSLLASAGTAGNLVNAGHLAALSIEHLAGSCRTTRTSLGSTGSDGRLQGRPEGRYGAASARVVELADTGVLDSHRRTDVRSTRWTTCPGGGTGRHRGLKSLCTQVRAGSSPALGTALTWRPPTVLGLGTILKGPRSARGARGLRVHWWSRGACRVARSRRCQPGRG